MGNVSSIAAIAAMNLAGYKDTRHGSGVIPMVKVHKKKEEYKETVLKARGFKNGIRDDEDDWLSRQLKEEAQALRRMNEEFGLKHSQSDAIKLKMEHALEHAAEREEGIRR